MSESVAKLVSYTLLTPIDIRLAKQVSYTVLMQADIRIAKTVTYVVLMPDLAGPVTSAPQVMINN